MQLKVKMTELNNSSFIFDEPQKPKLTSRIFVNSAKINLNRYWHKFEQLIADTKMVKRNKKKLRKLKSVNQQLLNNRIYPTMMKQQETAAVNNDEIYGFTVAKFPHQPATTITTTISSEPTSVKSAYKPFIDESLYHGVNLNASIPTLMTTSTKLPVESPYIFDKTSINYNYYLNESQVQQKSYHYNDNALYIQQLNESLRHKGYKFTLAEIGKATSDDMYFKGQYLEDEGYLV
ncbi:hypothetical protein PVAND_007281 [Polypedilum vanderplanki]|uniref:Uncharacterized protein n=1 Tax=Polypedilum vanderplanki TaxID=319348 RepID=A0A9J6C7C2_POLVA|nr:hypothetical protein PVAND_007281 [Polypedilum vanderplanki]